MATSTADSSIRQEVEGEHGCHPGDVFCLPSEYGDEESGGSTSAKGPGASINIEMLWSVHVTKLRVYFMDTPKIPEKWMYEEKPIQHEQIVSWAKEAWCKDKAIPELVLSTEEESAHIRVQFSDKGACWSMMGCCAIKASGATMMLNLSHKKNTYGQLITGKAHDMRIKSLVIHEFGHALGLEHEHQRSDFWDGVKGYLDLDRMRNDKRVETAVQKAANIASCGADWFETEEGLLQAFTALFYRKKPQEAMRSKYDSKSIMHYGFDRMWIKEPKYRYEKGIPSDLKGREYLIGILDTNEKLAEKPSDTDIITLAEAYKKHRIAQQRK